MPLNNILPMKSFLFLCSTYFSVILITVWSVFYSYSSLNSNSNSDSNNRGKYVEHRKRFDVSRRSGWRRFLEFLESHYEFTKAYIINELADGMSPITIERYLLIAREAGWVEIRMAKKEGRRRVYIYRSRLYSGGEK